MKQDTTYTWIATAAFGLEGIVANELKALGFADAKGETGGARFTATAERAFFANLWLRCADRVLLVLKEFEATTFEELFQGVKSIPWEAYLPMDAAFPVNGKCAKSQLMSVRDCQSITKKAIVERLRGHYKTDWFQEVGAEYAVDVALHNNIARITLDVSGTALNRRGYRTWNGEAPLRETLAAALLRIAYWRPGMPLHDPCCGTGTLLIEAAMITANRAPGLTRQFACENWHFMPQSSVEKLRNEAEEACNLDRIQHISGSDIDPEALTLCKKHIVQAGLGGRITVWQQDLKTLTLDAPRGAFITNPPYGERIGAQRESEALYRELRHLTTRQPGWTMGAITSHPAFERVYGKRADKKRRLYNGRLECNFYMYEAVEGRK